MRDSTGKFIKVIDYEKCYNCGSDKTYINKRQNKPYAQWYKHNDNWYCNKCHNRLFLNPKWNPVNNPKWNPVNNPKDIFFKGKCIHLKDNPRIGVCNLCRYVGLTHMHHTQYHEDQPLKDTIELCASCHRKQHLLH